MFLFIFCLKTSSNFLNLAISGTSTIINSKPKEYLNEENFENKIGKRKQRENIKNNNNIHPTVGVYDTNLETNMTRILNALIASHDRRIRPNFGGPPTIVNVTIHVITISAISEVSMDYTLDLYLRQFWHDSRLAFSGILAHQNLTVGIDMVKSIWTPDTFFPNEKKSYFHETTSHNSFLRIDSNGNVLRSIRLTVTANCPMSLHTFPLDKQVCPLEIESYGYSTSDIIYQWKQIENTSSLPVTIDDDVHLAHFSIGGFYQIERTISLSTGNYSRLTAYFTFKRNLGFYLIQIYFPSSLIVVISWVSFFLNREATQARVTIGVTTVLTQTTLMTSTNASLPKVSYVKSLDIFLGVCFFIVFASLLEYATVGFLMKRQRRRRHSLRRPSILPATALLPRSSTATVCFFELEDGTLRRMDQVIIPPPPPTQIQTNNKNINGHSKRFRNSCRKYSATPVNVSNGDSNDNCNAGHQPLLNNHRQSLNTYEQRPLSANRRPSSYFLSANHQSPINGEQRRPSCLLYLPEENAVPFCEQTTEEERRKSVKSINQLSKCSIRASHVDLFSRIAFPIFFVCFHLGYWLIYLNLE
uniref:Gamma-aminobutyric acid receptor subunit beta n=1 Tax=Meloidogyne incognita TaxID=6306 RepID=A0A914LIK6_MELIC